MRKNKIVKKGKWWFRGLKQTMRLRYKKPEFIFLDGKPFEDGSLILSNHEGTDAPMSLELYLDKPMRMWGAYEMNSGLKNMYKYQSTVYYHEKKHWNIHLARLFCLIASPVTNLFYKGFDLISTYHDARFITTIKESINAINNKQSVVIYPENSAKGYLAQLEGFFGGFAVFAEMAYKKGIDLPIVVSYYKIEENKFIFDKPVKYSELLAEFKSRDKIIERLLRRCNQLGTMTFDKENDNKNVDAKENIA